MLAIVATIGQFSTSIYIPSIPSMAIDMGVSVSLLQLTVAAYLVPVAFGQLALGALSDRIGRRRVLIGGMLVFLAGSALCATAEQIAPLFAGRILQGSGAAAGLIVSRAVARDLFEGPALVNALSTVAIAFALIPGVTPLLGGVVQDVLGWRAAFIITLLLGMAALVAYLRLVPESLASAPPPSVRQLFQGYRRLFSDGAFQRHAILSAGPIAGIFAFLTGGPVFAIAEQGLSASVFGLYPPLATTGFVVCNRLAMRSLPSAGSRPVVLAGLMLAASGSLLALGLRLAGLLDIIGLTACMWLFSGGMGIVVPICTAQAMQLHPGRAGSAAAVIGFEQMLGGVLGTLGVAALLPRLGSIGFPLVMSIAAVTVAGFFLLMTAPPLLPRGSKPD